MTPEGRTMKRIAVVLIIALTAAGSLASAQEIFGPRITSAELRHDMGTVRQGTQVSHVFEVKNEGTDTLVIQKVQPG